MDCIIELRWMEFARTYVALRLRKDTIVCVQEICIVICVRKLLICVTEGYFLVKSNKLLLCRNVSMYIIIDSVLITVT